MMTFGLLARHLGCLDSQIDRLAKKGRIPFQSTGRFRVVLEQDIPAVRQALIAAGYLPSGDAKTDTGNAA